RRMSICLILRVSTARRLPPSTLFPYTTLFRSPIHPDRTFGNEIPTGKAGDKLVLRTLMDSIVSVSACPQDLNPCNGFHPSPLMIDRKSTRLNSSHGSISYAVFCLKNKK